MNAIPAQVAGVERLVICAPTPGRGGESAGASGRAAVGVDTVYRIGGAQAMAAMAYGTETIAPVDKITGPGNAYVAAAKRRVFGKVGIDMIAGPSEILVIADADNDPDWIAVDLLSQAEHDESAQSILITDDEAFGKAVAEAVDKRSETLERRAIAGPSWRDYGAVIVVRDLSEAAALSRPDRARAPGALRGRPGGALRQDHPCRRRFPRPWTPEAIGDYVGGPNHVLPTARSARFSSGLSVLDFMKRTTLARMTPRRCAPSAGRRTLAGPKASRRMGFRCARGWSD
jgi:histidinol dehydrogenase